MMNKITKDTKWVKCVDNSYYPQLLTLNKVYRVNEINFEGRDILIDTGEVINWFAFSAFIPADEPEESNMHDFKVGDKVEVLSDANYLCDKNQETVVGGSLDVKTAIGKIGDVDEVLFGRIKVVNLPDECYRNGCGFWVYRPDQLRKIEDAPFIEKTQLITKDNIEDVLEFNGISKVRFTLNKDNIICWTKDLKFLHYVQFNNPRWLQLVEVYFGKLKPLPVEPKFDFVQHLLDNGWHTACGDLYFCEDYHYASLCIEGRDSKWKFNGKYIEPNEENAKLIVEMAKLSEGLS